MYKHRYKCETCKHTFDVGVIIQTGFDEYEEYNERCPRCESWNYYLTNLSIVTIDTSADTSATPKDTSNNKLYAIDYSSPSLGMGLFCSYDINAIQRAFNRLISLKWEVFVKVLDNSSDNIEAYLRGDPCLMNNFTPHKWTKLTSCEHINENQI